MGKGGGSAPSYPDQSKTIAQQQAANKAAVRESARVNAVDVLSPWGKTVYKTNKKGLPKQQITTLSRGGQRIYDAQMRATLGLSDIANTKIRQVPTDRFSLKGLPYDPNQYDQPLIEAWGGVKAPYDPAEYGSVKKYQQRAIDAFYDRQASLLEPTFQRQRDAAEQDLADRGIAYTSQGARNVIRDLEREQGDQYQRIAADAVLAGGAEAERTLGMEQGLRATARGEAAQDHQMTNADILSQVQAEQNLRGTALNERILQRTQAINEGAAALQGSPALPTPTPPAIPTYSVGAADAQGLAQSNYNAQVGAWNAQQQRNSALTGGVFGLLGAGISAFSAEELKEVALTTAARGLTLLDRAEKMPVRVWRYTNTAARGLGLDREPHVGPMAGDWRAHTGLGDGITIHLGDLAGFCLGCVQELNQENRVLRRRLDALEEAA